MHNECKNPTRIECDKCKKLTQFCDCTKCLSVTFSKAYKKNGITDNRNQRIK